jgi:hypothetical protein
MSLHLREGRGIAQPTNAFPTTSLPRRLPAHTSAIQDGRDPVGPIILAEGRYGPRSGLGPEQAHPFAQQLQRA